MTSEKVPFLPVSGTPSPLTREEIEHIKNDHESRFHHGVRCDLYGEKSLCSILRLIADLERARGLLQRWRAECNDDPTLWDDTDDYLQEIGCPFGSQEAPG